MREDVGSGGGGESGIRRKGNEGSNEDVGVCACLCACVFHVTSRHPV